MSGHVGDEQDVFNVILLMSRSPRKDIKLLAHTRLSLVLTHSVGIRVAHVLGGHTIYRLFYNNMLLSRLESSFLSTLR